ncbi:hypothetical protein AALO_G00034760 [Alosa alosa]|uniref:ATP synthase peripheral stalk subunit F6, mitochondrial n=1 Tax=Alosa alosa TaxID=278164 RepID=A0AAV6HAG6_9TELE|nr:hypothetical protein AALO_G00034760 [Alosa alosa]
MGRKPTSTPGDFSKGSLRSFYRTTVIYFPCRTASAKSRRASPCAQPACKTPWRRTELENRESAADCFIIEILRATRGRRQTVLAYRSPCDRRNATAANMAASLLRIGRLGALKCVQLESWASLRRAPAAAFSSKSGDKKNSKKKSKVTPQTYFDLEKMVQHRTLVDFPKKETVVAAAEAAVKSPVSEPPAEATAPAAKPTAAEPASEPSTPIAETVPEAAPGAEAPAPAEAQVVEAAPVAEAPVAEAAAEVVAEAVAEVVAEVVEAPVEAVAQAVAEAVVEAVVEAAAEVVAEVPAEASPAAEELVDAAADVGMDPIQKLFLDSIRQYSSQSQASGEMVDAGPEYQKALADEVAKLQRLYGGGDLDAFPEFTFQEPKFDEVAAK